MPETHVYSCSCLSTSLSILKFLRVSVKKNMAWPSFCTVQSASFRVPEMSNLSNTDRGLLQQVVLSHSWLDTVDRPTWVWDCLCVKRSPLFSSHFWLISDSLKDLSLLTSFKWSFSQVTHTLCGAGCLYILCRLCDLSCLTAMWPTLSVRFVRLVFWSFLVEPWLSFWPHNCPSLDVIHCLWMDWFFMYFGQFLI